MRRLLKRLFNLRGDLGSLFGGSQQGNQVSNINIPTFQQNQSFNTAQGNLATLGTNILSGNLPSYYSNLGNPNSQQFNALQQNVVGQTNAASAQQAAASGTDRSGVAATAAASSLANTLPSLDYSNYLNAQQQQQGLLGLGANVTQDVAQNGLTDQGQLNNFNLSAEQEQYQQSAYNTQYAQNVAAQKGQAIGDIGSLLFGSNVGGTIGNLFGSNTTAPSGNSSNGAFSQLLSSLGTFNN